MASFTVNDQVDDCISPNRMVTFTDCHHSTSTSIEDTHDAGAEEHSSEYIVVPSIRDQSPSEMPRPSRRDIRLKVSSIMSLARSRSRKGITSTHKDTTLDRYNRTGPYGSGSRPSHFSFSSDSSLESNKRLSIKKLKMLLRPSERKQTEGSASRSSHTARESNFGSSPEGFDGIPSVRYETIDPAPSSFRPHPRLAETSKQAPKLKRRATIWSIFRLKSFQKKSNIKPGVEARYISAPFQIPTRPIRPASHLCPDPSPNHVPQRSFSRLQRRAGLANSPLDKVPEERNEEEKSKKRWSGGSQKYPSSIACSDGSRYPNHTDLQHATTPPSRVSPSTSPRDTDNIETNIRKARRKIKTTSPELLAYINGVGDQFLDDRPAEFAIAPLSALYSSQGESCHTAGKRHRRSERFSQNQGHTYNANSSVASFHSNDDEDCLESLTSSPQVDEAVAVLISHAQTLRADAAARLSHALSEAINPEENNNLKRKNPGHNNPLGSNPPDALPREVDGRSRLNQVSALRLAPPLRAQPRPEQQHQDRPWVSGSAPWGAPQNLHLDPATTTSSGTISEPGRVFTGSTLTGQEQEMEQEQEQEQEQEPQRRGEDVDASRSKASSYTDISVYNAQVLQAETSQVYGSRLGERARLHGLSRSTNPKRSESVKSRGGYTDIIHLYGSHSHVDSAAASMGSLVPSASVSGPLLPQRLHPRMYVGHTASAHAESREETTGPSSMRTTHAPTRSLLEILRLLREQQHGGEWF